MRDAFLSPRRTVDQRPPSVQCATQRPALRSILPIEVLRDIRAHEPNVGRTERESMLGWATGDSIVSVWPRNHALLTIFLSSPFTPASAVSQFLDRSYEGKGMFFYIFSRLVACGCQSRVENLFSLAGRLIRTAKGQGKMRGPQRPSLARRGGFFFKIHDPLFA